MFDFVNDVLRLVGVFTGRGGFKIFIFWLTWADPGPWYGEISKVDDDDLRVLSLDMAGDLLTVLILVNILIA